MVKRLTRHGNSLAIVLDRPILDLLQATPETRFEVITDGQSLVLTPIRGAKRQKRLDEALADVHRRFGRAMKRLAE